MKEMCGCFTYILSNSDNDKLGETHVTVILKQILCYWMTVCCSHLYKNMHSGFSCLFFIHNLICDIFSLFIGIILSTNLLTELDIDRLGIHYKTFQCFIKSFTGAPTWCNARKCCPLAHRDWDIHLSIFCKTK